MKLKKYKFKKYLSFCRTEILCLFAVSTFFVGCTSKSEYENVTACYSKNVSSFQACCAEFKVGEAKCNEYGTRRSQELADKMTGTK